MEKENKKKEYRTVSLIQPVQIPKNMDLLDFFIEIAKRLSGNFNYTKDDIQEYMEDQRNIPFRLNPFNLSIIPDTKEICISFANYSQKANEATNEIVKKAVEFAKSGEEFNASSVYYEQINE